MIALLVLLPLLVLAPFFCYDAGLGWPVIIRDRLLLVLGWSTAAGLCWLEPGLGLFWLVVLAHWRGLEHVKAVVTVGAGIGVYLLARQVPAELLPIITQAIVAGTVAQLALAAYQVWRDRSLSWHTRREAARGTVGNRVVLGCLCAMTVPLAAGWLVPVLAAGVLLSQSFSALASLVVAVLVLHPSWAWGVVPATALAWAWVQYRRPTPVAGMQSRLVLAHLCLRALRRAPWGTRLIGFGPGAFFRSSRWWLGQRQTTELFKHAHNDAVQAVYEWGLVGLAGGLIFAVTLFWRGGFGAPMTAALAAVAVNAMWQFPLHLPHVLAPTLVLAGMVGR
jgi:hypothetical protein